jgi:hypothetical protein
MKAIRAIRRIEVHPLPVALTGLIVPSIGNTWELTNTQPNWPLLLIGVALFCVSLVLLMQIHANWVYRKATT